MSVNPAANSTEFSCYAERGDTIQVRLWGGRLSEALQRCFGSNGVHDSTLSLQGIFSHSWTLHEFSRREDPHFNESYEYCVDHRDQELSNAFNFVKYRSPTDTVSVAIPGLPSELSSATYSEDYDVCDTQKKQRPENDRSIEENEGVTESVIARNGNGIE